MFTGIYDIYEKEIASIPFVCRRGCATCCTQSVTMTGAEGQVIMAFLAAQGRKLPVLPEMTGRPLPGPTVNTFAACCLEGRDLPDEPEEAWIYEPCIFLAGDACAIYPARPFACRSFGSVQPCLEHGIAEAPGWFITINTMVNQLIEHLDRGGCWGNMVDVLDYLANGDEAPPAERRAGANRLRTARSLPGFLIPPGEEEIVGPFWERLARAGVTAGRNSGEMFWRGHGNHD